MPENDEKDKKDVNAEAPLTTAKFEALPVTVIIWQPFAHIHFHSACVLCKKAVEVEALHDGSQQSRDALTDEYMGYVTGTIFTAAAFLEALINETFLRAVIRAKGEPADFVQKLSPDVIASMAQAWKNGVDWSGEPLLRQFLTNKDSRPPKRWYILDKYQLALYFADKSPYKKPFDKNGKLWEDSALLQELRNALIHHKPESIAFPPTGDPYQAETTRITTLLQELNKRNFTNALYSGQSSLLTLLGSKCASWAVSQQHIREGIRG